MYLKSILAGTTLSVLLSSFPLPASAAGVIVAAGGGSEGNIGDTSAWSYKLYKRLVDNGDVNGDGRVTVAILSYDYQNPWLPTYFKSLGAADAYNVRVANRTQANDPAVVDVVNTADVIYLKGGDQGKYYDYWNGTLLEAHIRTVVETRNGAIGGTSAGAASLSQYCLASNKNLDSINVLQDAMTPYLDDLDGGTGIHPDFLDFVPKAYIDTHYTTRGRNARMLGVIAKASQDNQVSDILGIGLDERTGIVISNGIAEVIGVGAVDFVHPTSSTVLVRESKKPLYYTHLHLDRLVEGWRYDLTTRQPDVQRRPSTALPVTYPGDGAINSGALTLKGNKVSEEERFAWTVDYDPAAYKTQKGTLTPSVLETLGLVNAYDGDFTGAIHESVFRALYDHPGTTGFLVAAQGQLSRTSTEPDVLSFEKNSSQTGREAATLIVDTKGVTWKDLSPSVSSVDTGGGSLHAAALIGAKLHVMGETAVRGGRYNTRTHTVVGGPSR